MFVPSLRTNRGEVKHTLSDPTADLYLEQEILFEQLDQRPVQIGLRLSRWLLNRFPKPGHEPSVPAPII